MEIATALGTEIALSAVSSVFNKLGTYLGGDVTPEEMEHLKLFLLSEISVFIEEGKSTDLVQLRPLLDKLQDAALQVDDLLDLYQYNQIKKQVTSSSTNFFKKLIPILKEKLACILPKSSSRLNLENLLYFIDQVEKHPFIKLTKPDGQRTQQKHKSPEATTSTPTSLYFGRDEQYESIVKLLLAEPRTDSDRMKNEVPVITIKGLGGSGKTLTAQRVCTDKRILNDFDKPMWVHATTDFDVEKLTRKIIESANNGECPQSTNLDVLQTSLKELVKKRKKFLLVLDDVWCEDKAQWDRLAGPLNEVGQKGSKIIITTRVAQVARLHAEKENIINLDELEIESCWSILKYYAFNNSEHVVEDPELVNIGNQIISKARSSPLALKVVGSSLHDTTNVDEWERILKRNILDKTMDLLSFSFQRLPSHLQRCFAYCSLFPKGYIHKEQLLVPLWIAQGYITENTNDELTLEEKGSMYIDDLLSYSFFEKDSNNQLVIHDLLHDLAETASGNLCHKIEHYDSSMNIPENCIHLSMNTTVEFESIDISDISKLINLRSLIILDDASCTNIFRDNTDIFQILSKLRALYVKSDRNMEVLSNLHIDQLKHLRYLHLQYDKKLPESLTKLYHLQFFILNVGSTISEHSNGDYYLMPNILPQGFGNLINLRTLTFLENLFVEEADYLKCNSEVISIEKLKSLQNVPAFYIEKDNVNGMVPLKNLPLRGSLKICGLENIKSKEDAEKAMLKGKKNLNKLELEWGSSTSDGSNDVETCKNVLEGLEPHQNLKSLLFKGYQSVMIANWMINKSLRLQTLTLLHCESIREINFLPPYLRELKVECCKELTQLSPFGSTLEQLTLIDCPVLMRLQSMRNISPSLGFLKVKNCPMLMTDELSLLVKKVAERDTAKCFSQAQRIETDEPLLVLVLVQQQGFSFIKHLFLKYTEAKPFPPLLEGHFAEFSSLNELQLVGFKTLPHLEKLSSLETLFIIRCPEVELLPKFPISLHKIIVIQCPRLKAKYNEEEGPLHQTISHIRDVYIYS